MFRIVDARFVATGIKRFVIEAPRIAEKYKPGQFVIVRLHEHGERVPLTIQDVDHAAGTINLCVQALGKTTHLMNLLETGDAVLDVMGPLGKPSEIRSFGTVVLVAGAVGAAMTFSTARALRQAGNYVIAIEGARRQDLVVLEDELRQICDETHIVTDDGSYGEKGLVTDKLARLMAGARPVNFVLACGPVPMMRAVASLTKTKNIPTVVSLNSIMVDGTGMCGGCRVLIDGHSEFACVDGPEFPAERVNFDVLTQRNAMYRDKEQQSFAAFQADAEKDVALLYKNCRPPAQAGGSSLANHPASPAPAPLATTAGAGQNRMPAKERMKIPRQHMPERLPEVRITNFEEVNLGFTPELVEQEANRCISCGKPTCVKQCPVGVKVREFIDLIVAKDYIGAAAKMREDNVLPAITGRVCPQEEQCEGGCLLAKKAGAVGIGYLERFIADWEMTNGTLGLPPIAPPSGKKVAIVGSGPAGLTCAGDLIQKGHKVRVFEALHELGGVLVYGIPEFRLPKDIVRKEIDNLGRMGVEFETDVVVGRTVTVDDLLQKEHYDAIFIATGAGLPVFLGIPGEHLNGVYSANEFLTRTNLMRAYKFPEYDQPIYDCRGKDVIVFGGGNTAMDAVRTARRLGAKSATILYRRSEAEMPARLEEAKHAKEEGIIFRMLATPLEFSGDEKGWLKQVKCQQMQLGEPDDSGRRRPVPVAGSEFILPCDVAIVAVGTSANPLIQSTTPDLATNKRKYIQADSETQRTSKPGVFAGGDIVTGAATVILAMGSGRRAAKSVHEYLTSGKW